MEILREDGVSGIFGNGEVIAGISNYQLELGPSFIDNGQRWLARVFVVQRYCKIV